MVPAGLPFPILHMSLTKEAAHRIVENVIKGITKAHEMPVFLVCFFFLIPHNTPRR